MSDFTIIQCKCNEFKIIDERECEDDSYLNITGASITYNNIWKAYDYSEEPYNKEFILTPDMFNLTSFKDGDYEFHIELFEGSEVVKENKIETFSKCNIQKKIDSFIYDILTLTCSDCKKEKIKKATEYNFKLELLCYAVACSNYDKANNILQSLENDLINYNCKNC